MILALVVAAGCTPTPDDGCGRGRVELALDPGRVDFPALDESDEVPVFIPPQGGIFTELDLHVRGIAIEDIAMVRVTIDPAQGARIADQAYPGFGVPLLCLGDGTAFVPRMPVRLAEALVLDELDGVEGELLLRVSTQDDEHERRWGVTLRVTTF